MKTQPRLNTLAAMALAIATLAPMSIPSHAAPSTPANAPCPSILQHRFDRLQDEKPQDLCQYAGQVVLVVNTASYCGFTQQYKGLEELYRRYRDRGLVVLGFPSNDFGQQEPGSNQQIAEFCENTFGVQFPMFAKSHVRGPQANALFRQLAERTGTTPKWNFYKYLISRDGRTVLAYNSLIGPDSESLRRDIERLLGS
ncbi:MAG: glutathione peroxidase [Tepidimonas sp.]|uniref:glutathione peroxidase n=1 Tax=Tepidimonas sp. TaxID=2002775 RepID=UPI00259D7810|nr:glutathione peroxidase [Tepidimonas sp.]MDM7456624.1 glutathione peroxidase [Tepidimonas sp.]